MSDQTVFTTRGHVFHIDPDSRKKWLPSTDGPVGLSLFFDEQRKIYRLVACDANQKVVLNSIMQANMTFTKTSAKFGQWSDKSSGHNVYGVGFSSESDLNKFSEEFNKAKSALKASDNVREMDTTASNLITPKPEFNDKKDSQKRPSSTELRMRSPPSNGATHQQQSPLSPDVTISPPHSHPPAVPQKRDSLQDIDATLDLATKPPPGADEMQALRYESRRLKAALGRSSENAKKWEAELQTLKNNNARLTAALQDSASNVSEWKAQLKAYKEESGRLKQRAHEAETRRDGQSDSLSTELDDARRGRVETEKKLHGVEDSLANVKLELETAKDKHLEEIKLIKLECTTLQEKLDNLQATHTKVETAYQQAVSETERSFEMQTLSHQELSSLKSSLKAKLTEAMSLIDSE